MAIQGITIDDIENTILIEEDIVKVNRYYYLVIASNKIVKAYLQKTIYDPDQAKVMIRFTGVRGVNRIDLPFDDPSIFETSDAAKSYVVSEFSDDMDADIANQEEIDLDEVIGEQE